MTESATDPLSGLPLPTQGIKASPLNQAGGSEESHGERWWLNDSVQPMAVGGVEPTDPSTVNPSEAQQEPTVTDVDTTEPAPTGEAEAEEPPTKLTEYGYPSSESRMPMYLIAIALVGITVFAVFGV